MNDVMLDIETLSTSVRGVILSAALMFFDSENLGDSMHVHLDVDVQIRQGRVVDWSTFSWWMQQSDEARKKVIEPVRVHHGIALMNIRSFILRPILPDDYVDIFEVEFPSSIRVWAKSPHFDGAMLEDMWRREFSLSTAPDLVRYNGWRDVRTACDGIEPPEFEGDET